VSAVLQGVIAVAQPAPLRADGIEHDCGAGRGLGAVRIIVPVIAADAREEDAILHLLSVAREQLDVEQTCSASSSAGVGFF
jgi:hypothetical protein